MHIRYDRAIEYRSAGHSCHGNAFYLDKHAQFVEGRKIYIS